MIWVLELWVFVSIWSGVFCGGGGFQKAETPFGLGFTQIKELAIGVKWTIILWYWFFLPSSSYGIADHDRYINYTIFSHLHCRIGVYFPYEIGAFKIIIIEALSGKPLQKFLDVSVWRDWRNSCITFCIVYKEYLFPAAP